MAGFGDRVRIKTSEETQQAGLAGREGVVFGLTTPSVTKVTVIGDATGDFALNVHVDELDEGFWFADHLVEFVDHQEGTVLALDGIDVEWVRAADGQWQERPRKTWLSTLLSPFRSRK